MLFVDWRRHQRQEVIKAEALPHYVELPSRRVWRAFPSLLSPFSFFPSFSLSSLLLFLFPSQSLIYRFFLSASSIYMIVVDSATKEAVTNAMNWIKNLTVPHFFSSVCPFVGH